MPPTHYDVLNVSPKAELEVIKASYKALALKYHPDRNREGGNDQRMKSINSAYEVLSSPEARAKYDKHLHDNELIFLTKEDLDGARGDADREFAEAVRRGRAQERAVLKKIMEDVPSYSTGLKDWQILLIKLAIAAGFSLVAWWMAKTDGWRILGFVLLIGGVPALFSGLFNGNR